MSEQQNFAASSYPLPRIYNLPNAIATYWCRGLLEQHFASMLMTRTSSWIALRNPTFGKLWVATVVSGICVSAHDTAAIWIMKSLSHSTMLLIALQRHGLAIRLSHGPLFARPKPSRGPAV